MSETLSPAQLDKLFGTTYLILFNPRPDLAAERLEQVRQSLYDLRRLIPDILSVRITETLVEAPGSARFACFIGYRFRGVRLLPAAATPLASRHTRFP